MTRLVAVVMAGGGGTRLWPASRQGRPKQILQLAGERSLFADALARLRPWLADDQILIAASAEMGKVLQGEAGGLVPDRLLIEPEPKGTAPVLGLAAVYLQAVDPGAIMAVLTSDHAIGNPDRLRALLEAGAELAADGYLVTLGIPPTGPDTGYGYLRRGESLGERGGERAFAVAEFKEKPDPQTAAAYLASGEYAWNSGMFLWQPQRLLDEIAAWMPDLHAALKTADVTAGRPPAADFASRWGGLASETIDYGIMERADRVAVIDAAGLEWSDVGNWDRVFQLAPRDGDDNAALGSRLLAFESRGNLVVGEGSKDRLVVLQGVEGLAIVEAGDVVLVCRRDQAGRVRQIVEALEGAGLDRYLK